MEGTDVGAVARIVLRIAHALSGAIWLGSGTYLVLALLPQRRLSAAASETVRIAQQTFRRWWIASSAILVGSGVALMFDRVADGKGTATYVGLLVIKVVAGVVALGASGGLLPRPVQASMRPVRSLWRIPDRLVLVLGALAYLLGVLLSVIYPPDPTAGWR